MDTNLKWINLEDSAIPPFTIGCITNYFVSRIADDGLPRNDYKHLNSHAYPLFKAGHIQSISVAMQADTYKIRCKWWDIKHNSSYIQHVCYCESTICHNRVTWLQQIKQARLLC